MPRQALLEYQAILENASVGILFTRDRKVVRCNPKLSDIFGWPHGELVGQSGAVFWLSDADYAEIGRIATPVLTSGRALDLERFMRSKHGSAVYCRIRAQAVNPRRTAEGTIWIVEDISEKKFLEEELARAHRELEHKVVQRTEELEQARQKLQAVIECAPFAIYTRDTERRVTSWNPAAERIFGWTADEVIGRPMPSIPEEKKAEAEALFRRVASGQTIVQLELQRQRRDGAMIDVSFTIAPLRHQASGEIDGYLSIVDEVTQRKEAQKQIAHLAYHDALTDLPNRLLLQDRLQQAIAHAERTGSRVALLLLDLDGFKQINDTLGHAVGDMLLRGVTARLLACVRDSDTVGREGGDEFAVVLRDLNDGDAAVPVMDKIIARLQAPFEIDGNDIATSVSIGVSIYPDDGGDYDTLRRQTDMAMYKAKEAGRNTYRFFDETMNAEALEHLVLRNGLRRALQEQEFVLHYQPQIDLRSGRVTGVEALIRWNHPELGLVPPGRFIPVAEDSGLIVPLGEWVLREACRQAVAWQATGLPALVMAVNLSVVQFKRGDVEQTVLRALQESGLDPALLELELTESILIQNVGQVLASVKRLKQQGVKLSIDDFGTGYSSLSYLKHLDIDKLKIDQSFVRDLATDADDAAIVRAIIQMGHSLELTVIAEGVETPDMLQRLRDFHCDEAQGYHFAQPMPADEFAAYLARAQA